MCQKSGQVVGTINKNFGDSTRPLIKFWGCNENYLWRYSPQNHLNRKETINNILEASTTNDVARNIPRISVIG